MSEPFDIEEARRLVHQARAIEGELTDLEAWGRRIDEEYLFRRIKRDREGQDRAGEESQRLAELCTKRAKLWEALAIGLDVEDLSTMREAVAAIRASAEDAFRRMEGEWCSAE